MGESRCVASPPVPSHLGRRTRTNQRSIRQARAYPVAEQPSPAQHHKGRAMRYRALTRFPDTFTKHQIDKPIPVSALVKCKMQDNLEFLQWTKRFWDLNFPDHDYDAVARRKGGALPPGGSASRPAPAATTAARRGGNTPSGGTRVAKAAGPGTAALQQENATLKETVVGLERERDFYFSKLRDIELLVQQAVDEDPELEKQEDGLVKHIQAILYSTEEGFEIPDDAAEDQETF
ncbi:EB1-like domain-containing protein [Ilyonectria robusta]